MDDLKDLLRRSFDAELTTEEQHKLDDALKESEGLRMEKKSIENMRKLLASSTASFSAGFGDRVVESIEKEERTDPQIVQFYSIFKRIAITGAAAIIALLIAIYFIDGGLSTEALIGISDYSPEVAELSFFETSGIE